MLNNCPKYNVVDLFSGAGGMSCGFHRHPGFRLLAAADAEYGKPSSGAGALGCNSAYQKNIGIRPASIDLSIIHEDELRSALNLAPSDRVQVLSVCPPCTGFSRANPGNHQTDDQRNSLVEKSARFGVALDADIIVMENARELIRGNFKHHYRRFCEYLQAHGYKVSGKSYLLTEFGLPQRRERAIVLAVKRSLPLYTLEDLWEGRAIREQALSVRTAFAAIDRGATGIAAFPGFSSALVKKRMAAVPKNGGSWMDLLKTTNGESLLTESMKRIVATGRIGSYPDVYGRMSWSRPAPTIKRECSHVGNGRYAHPEENRLCSVREMAILQGFPNDFVFAETSISNLYRHIGDAVPPLIAYQIAHICDWILGGKKPPLQALLLAGTHLRAADLIDQRHSHGPEAQRESSQRTTATDSVSC